MEAQHISKDRTSIGFDGEFSVTTELKGKWKITFVSPTKKGPTKQLKYYTQLNKNQQQRKK